MTRASGRPASRAIAAWLVRAALLSAAPLPAGALPVFSVDADPDLPGVQDFRSVPLGSSFAVALLIEGVDPAHPLHAFELALSYGDATTASAAELGGFLAAPRLVVENDTTGSPIRFAATTIGPLGSSGAGVLVLLEFEAVAIGESVLSLRDVLLAEPFGVPIDVGELRGAAIRVVPEAAPGAMIGVGILLLAARRR